MEWLLRQQLLFLPQGAVVGLGLGVLLDVIGGYWRGKSYRHLLFVFDLLLCVIASVITLFTALIVADGYLHPAIFVGRDSRTF